jgi:RNA polymerase sigma factor (sigma-70 family)
MRAMSEADLLQAFVQNRDADAFRHLVEIYADVVFATARRQVRSHQSAEDVTQAVFMLLARKARSVQPRYLAGWLIKTTHLVALESLRRDSRRRHHETEAAVMQQILADQKPGDPVTPLLDDALNHLGPRDRTAVTLRYLQGRNIEEVSAAMGISESAAAKRVSRAVGRMRKYFARRGADAPVASILTALAAQHDLKAPSHLAHQAATAATSEAPSTPPTTSASLTNAAVATMSATALSRFAAIIGIAVLLVGGAFGIHRMAIVSELAATTTTHPRAAATTQRSPTGKIRIGMILSHRNSTETGWIGRPYSWAAQASLLPFLKDPNFEFIPVIERGTQDQDEMPVKLKEYFKSTPPIDSSNVEELKTLHVIIANCTWRTTDELAASIETAVNSGVGFLNVAAMGKEGPEYGPDHPVTSQLAGLEDGQYVWKPTPVDCKALANHPLLGKQSLRRAKTFQLLPNGVRGTLPKDAVPLIGLADPADLNLDDDPPFYLLYLSFHGQGRIVGCNIAPYGNAPLKATQFLGPKFYINCVKWAANRSLD